MFQSYEDVPSLRQRICDGNFLAPDYKGHCITRIPELISILFGLESRSHQDLFMRDDVILKLNGNPQNIVLLTIDAIGYDAWNRCRKDVGFMRRVVECGNVIPLTSVFPSETAAALTTINTGLTPREHGLLSMLMYSDELARPIQTLRFCPSEGHGADQPDYFANQSVDPSVLFSKRSVWDDWKSKGIDTYRVVPTGFVNSSYTCLTQPSSSPVSYDSYAELAVNLARVVNDSTRRTFVHAYVPDLDMCAHRYGPYSDQWDIELRMLMLALERCVEMIDLEQAKNTVFLVAGDHGHVKLDPLGCAMINDFVNIEEVCATTQTGSVIYPWGSPRCMFMRIRNECFESVFNALSGALQGVAMVEFSRQSSYLLGPWGDHPKLENRFGDIFIVPFNGRTVWYRRKDKAFTQKLGGHGGLTPGEMLTVLGFANMSDLKV